MIVLPDFIADSTLPQWVTAFSSTGILGVAATFVLKWRKLSIEEKGLALTSEEQIRDHYAKEVEAMRSKLDAQEGHFQRMEKHWRDMLEASDKRHQECEDRSALLREELNAMHIEIQGLRAQVRAASTDRVLMMEEAPPEAPHARAAAHRVKRIIDQ